MLELRHGSKSGPSYSTEVLYKKKIVFPAAILLGSLSLGPSFQRRMLP